ncbi:ABC transporter substrate-binding protein [Microbacterium sp. SORGH_AS_0888]|uniref:ABC transporter substrate-binding protein n=1 Tax=Microbacterium sp. SORGH_AS_0888 TaxID=3041791 RepID=UPI002782875B|nr:ABC transporter substrate-binding protein [Microbacterium sp. SORGH_AS_0888]MDQ1131275.1 NitT/TauT family transport system substrate-binding protein [Microbacterium sp. SORGH_AS_0888]
MPYRPSRRPMALLIGIGSVFALAACSSAPATDASSGSASLTHVRVSTLGFCDDPIVWGIDQGIFADAGLDVELVTVQSGAAGVSALQADEIDIAYANPLTSLQAIENGVDLKIVSGSSLSNEKSYQVVVAGDSGITNAAGLEGATIAVNALGSLGEIMTARWIADNGRGATAQFVALPFADQVPSVKNGTVTAASTGYTQAAASLADGSIRSLGNPYYDGVGEIPTSFYVAGSGWVSANEGAAESFASAMTTLAASASDPANDDARFAVTAAACGSTAADLADTLEPTYTGQLDAAQVSSLVDILVDAKAISSIDLAAVLPDWARTA